MTPVELFRFVPATRDGWATSAKTHASSAHRSLTALANVTRVTLVQLVTRFALDRDLVLMTRVSVMLVSGVGMNTV